MLIKTAFYMRIAMASFMILCLITIGAKAENIPDPTGDVLLTVSGSLANRNSGDVALIDLQMLKNLPQSALSTSTIWTDEVNKYTGVSLVDMIEFLGGSGSSLRAIAINDYSIDIPVSDAVINGPIIAYLVNGDELSARDKGPLWIIYPFDTNEEYRNEQIYARSIWQLDRIEILE